MTDSTFSRRALLGAAAGVGLTVVGTGVSARLALGQGGNGFASSFDTNQDGTGEMVIQRARRTVGQRQGPLVNATTFGDETPDYAASLVNVNSRNLSLDDLASSEDGFVYDYYEGRDSTNPGPDEAWVVLNSGERGQQGRHILFRKLEDSRNGAEGEGRGNSSDNGGGPGESEGNAGRTWRTRNVGEEIAGADVSAEGLSFENWREFSIDDHSVSDVGTNDLVEEFGGDAKVKWVGIGRGSPGWKSFVADTYYDEVVVVGEHVTLPVTDEQRGGPSRGRS